MNRNLLTLAICLITLGSLSAQSFIGKINPTPNHSSSISADDTIKILAVMVNFQEDRDGATFGNGKFGSIYSQDYGTDILDPLPHDQQYFESHLTFVKNYFQKVSNSKAIVQFTILPDTFSVSKTMRNYAPAPGSIDLTPIGQFSEEVWTMTDQMYAGFFRVQSFCDFSCRCWKRYFFTRQYWQRTRFAFCISWRKFPQKYLWIVFRWISGFKWQLQNKKQYDNS